MASRHCASYNITILNPLGNQCVKIVLSKIKLVRNLTFNLILSKSLGCMNWRECAWRLAVMLNFLTFFEFWLNCLVKCVICMKDEWLIEHRWRCPWCWTYWPCWVTDKPFGKRRMVTLWTWRGHQSHVIVSLLWSLRDGKTNHSCPSINVKVALFVVFLVLAMHPFTLFVMLLLHEWQSESCTFCPFRSLFNYTCFVHPCSK